MPTPVNDYIRRQIPDDLRTQNVEPFATVLDGMHDVEIEHTRKAMRVFCPPLLTNLSFLRARTEDLGWPSPPADFPKEILDAMVLNAEAVFSAAGSYRGIDYWLRVLTQGAPTYGDEEFLPIENYIVLDDLERGYLSDDTFNGLYWLQLFSGDETDILPGELHVSVASPYASLASLTRYLNDTFRQILGFTNNRTVLSIVLTEGPYVPNPYANPFFVI